MRQNFVPLGGVCVYFLKSVRKCRFRNGAGTAMPMPAGAHIFQVCGVFFEKEWCVVGVAVGLFANGASGCLRLLPSFSFSPWSACAACCADVVSNNNARATAHASPCGGFHEGSGSVAVGTFGCTEGCQEGLLAVLVPSHRGNILLDGRGVTPIEFLVSRLRGEREGNIRCHLQWVGEKGQREFT